MGSPHCLSPLHVVSLSQLRITNNVGDAVLFLCPSVDIQSFADTALTVEYVVHAHDNGKLTSHAQGLRQLPLLVPLLKWRSAIHDAYAASVLPLRYPG